MKLPPFDYAAPTTLEEAVKLLASCNGMAKALSGGQSLLPVMAFRLAAPTLLVDLRKVPDLDSISIDGQGVRLGARVRWCNIHDDARLRKAHPLLVAAIKHVAHYQIRNRGTVGGSLAHADPSAEMPGIAVVCDAEIVVVGPKGLRIVRAGNDFFTGPLSTVLEHDELITEVRLPPWPAARRWAFEEFAMRRGDFALAGVALFYDTDASDRVENAHVSVIGACSRPHRLLDVEAELDGSRLEKATIDRALEKAAAVLDPQDDLHASADYRRALFCSLLERALKHSQDD